MPRSFRLFILLAAYVVISSGSGDHVACPDKLSLLLLHQEV